MKKNKDKKKKKVKPMDAWVETNIERLMLKPGIQKLFKIKDEDALNNVSNAFKNEERIKTGALKGLEPFKTRYSEKEIYELAKTLNWNGKGTESNPIIIESIDGLPQIFSIIADLHVKIKDCTFDHVILYNCQNISIENCSFNTLGVVKSSKILVKSSTLSNLNLEYSNDNNFKECSIAKANNVRSQANIFENCTITNQVKRVLEEGLFELSKVVRQFPYIILAAGFGIAVFTVIHIVKSIPFGLYWYLSLIIFFGLIVVFTFLSKSQKEYTPNKIISNQHLRKDFKESI